METSFGFTAKKLRVAKNINVKDIAGEIISYPQILKFENGQTMISVDKLIYILNYINVSPEEFEQARHELIKTSDLALNQQVDEAFWNKNISKLKYLLKDAHAALLNFPDNPRYIMNIIEIKAALLYLDNNYKISQYDIDDLVEYLLSINEWSKYEIWLFSNCAGLISNIKDDKCLKGLTNKMLYAESHNFHSKENQSKINIALMNIISIFISNQNYEPIHDWFLYLEEHIYSDVDMYERATFTYLKALYNFRRDNCNQYKLERVEKCISAFETLGCFNLVNLMNDELNSYR